MSGRSRSSALRSTVTALRAAALSCDDGGLIGWEEDLVPRFGISRPTLRQAAAIVAQEQLITVRRGAGGGYFARRPDARAVTHMTAIYLQSHSAQVEEVVRAAEPITVELARLAARCTDATLHAQMRDFLDIDESRDAMATDFDRLAQTSREFGRILGEMSGNKVLSLFLAIIYDFIFLHKEADDWHLGCDEAYQCYRRDRHALYRSGRLRLGRAVLSRDEEAAVDCARRNAASATSWLIDDMERREQHAARERQKAASPGEMTDAPSPWAELLR